MMNRIIVGLGVGLLFGLTQSTDAQQQKKALDINACMSWKRVDSPEISSRIYVDLKNILSLNNQYIKHSKEG